MSPPFAAILFDLLMAVMDSPAAWHRAAGDVATGLRWRDAVAGAMIRSGRYQPYEELVTRAAHAIGLPPSSAGRLWAAWAEMEPRSDAGVIETLDVPYGFVTNCSSRLAAMAAARSGLEPAFTLSAEEAGWYKPRREIYREACVRIGAAPARVRFVAGAAYDAEGAHDAGLRSVLVLRRPMPPGLHASIVPARDLAEALDDRREPPGDGAGW